MIKRNLCMTLCTLAIIVLLAGCASKAEDGGTIETLSFAESTSLAKIESLNGKQVTIVGYMATLSPINGKYIYLMNLPYQSCPFCVPNTTQLANTIAVYAKEGESFAYTEQAVRITGKIELGDFSDDYGYEYNYRVVDARSETIDLSTVSDEYALWQSIAADGIVPELYSMFDYLYFACQWTEYMSSGEDGFDAYFLYPGDAENILADDGPYGYAAYRAEDYFSKLADRVKAIDKNGLSDLVKIIEDAGSLEQDAIRDLSDQKYAYDEEEDKYVLNNTDALASRFDDVYERFTVWIAKWEM